MVQQDVRDRDADPTKASDPDYLRRKRVKEAKRLARHASLVSSELLENDERVEDQIIANMIIALDACPFTRIPLHEVSNPEARRKATRDAQKKRNFAAGLFRKYQLDVLYSMDTRFYERASIGMRDSLARMPGSNIIILQPYLQHMVLGWQAQVTFSPSFVSHDAKIAHFTWVYILTDIIPTDGLRGTLTRIAIRDTCAALRSAYYESEVMCRRIEDLVFDARFPEKVKVLAYAAKRRWDLDKQLYAQPTLRPAADDDLNGTVYYPPHFSFFPRSMIPPIGHPRLYLYSFEEPLQHHSEAVASVHGSCTLQASEVCHDSMFSGRDGCSDEGGRAVRELWTADLWKRTLFGHPSRAAISTPHAPIEPTLTVSQIRDIVVGRFRSTFRGNDARDGAYSIYWSSSPHRVPIILNEHTDGWLPMYALQPIALRALLGDVAGLLGGSKSDIGSKIRRGYVCEYPDCARSTSATGEKLLKCGRCHDVLYCSKECQKRDWGDHKAACAVPARADGENGIPNSTPSRQAALDLLQGMAHILALNATFGREEW